MMFNNFPLVHPIKHMAKSTRNPMVIYPFPTMSYVTQENEEKMIIEQHLDEYKNSPLERFTF